jgi:uncharacterized protein
LAANLKGRLARIRATRAATATEDSSPSRRAKPSFLEGWDEAAEFVWTRTIERRVAFPPSIDPRAFAPLRPPAGAVPRVGAAPAPSAQAAPELDSGLLRFFDLETTGLSGGTGTIAFLASVGRLAGGERLEIAQVFLEDFPGEGAFVALILGLLGEVGTVVSYNGRSFDMPLLRTRCVMTSNALPALAHVDALYAARRLWSKSCGGASLGLLEAAVLGTERGEDIPGEEIPEAWLSFARGGEGPRLGLVLSHNAADVAGLCALVARVQSAFDDPAGAVSDGLTDLLGLGRSLIAAGRELEGERLLRKAARRGDGAAALVLCRRLRASGRAKEAARLAALLPDSFRAATELAKLYERDLGDLEEAERRARRALELAPGEAAGEAAERRLARIVRKRSGG